LSLRRTKGGTAPVGMFTLVSRVNSIITDVAKEPTCFLGGERKGRQLKETICGKGPIVRGTWEGAGLFSKSSTSQPEGITGTEVRERAEQSARGEKKDASPEKDCYFS